MTRATTGVRRAALEFPHALAAALILHGVFAVVVVLVASRVPAQAADVDRWVGDWLELSAVVVTRGPAGAAEAKMSSPEPTPRKPIPTKAVPMPARMTRPSRPVGDWLSVADQLPPESPPKPVAQNAESSRFDKAAREVLAFRPRVSSSEGDPEAERAREQARPSPAQAAALGASEAISSVRRLATAFTRAIPVATDSDSAWRSFPAGRAGNLDVTLEIDDQGVIVDYELHGSPPPQMKRLLNRTLRYLERGRFALSPPGLQAGSQRFEVEVTLSDRSLVEVPRASAKPENRFAYGYEPPRLEKAGKAWFQYVSGRYFEATVRLK